MPTSAEVLIQALLATHAETHAGGGDSGPFAAIAQDARKVATERRYYLGFDARRRFGNTRIEPTCMYLLCNRKFTASSAALTGVDKVDIEGHQAILEVGHLTGNWLFAGKFGDWSGDKADDDHNNRGIGTRADAGGAGIELHRR